MSLTSDRPEPASSEELLKKLEGFGCTLIECDRIVSSYPLSIITPCVKKVENADAVRSKAPYLLRLLEIEMEPIRAQEAREHHEKTKKGEDEAEHARLKALIQSLPPERFIRMKDYMKKRLGELALPMVTKERILKTLKDIDDPKILSEDVRIIVALRMSLQTKSAEQ